MFKELTLGRGVRIGEKRVARLMRQVGLVAVSGRKRKGSTTRAKEHPLASDLVQRDFDVDAPDRLWVADFTQLTTWQGTAYIAVVADAYSRLCLGWAVRAAQSVARELALEALDMAIWRRGRMRASGAVHHSDQGSQYTSFAFTKRLAAEGIVASMGTVGDALDNAMCESLAEGLAPDSSKCSLFVSSRFVCDDPRRLNEVHHLGPARPLGRVAYTSTWLRLSAYADCSLATGCGKGHETNRRPVSR